MRRLSDHFKYCIALDEGNRSDAPLPAEQPSERPPIFYGRFRGYPLWFHRVEATGGRYDKVTGFETDEGEFFNADDAIACLQYEHYAAANSTRTTWTREFSKWLYYFLKPWMPRALQLTVQRLNARQRLYSLCFPKWPYDATLSALMSAFLAERMRHAGFDSIPFLGFWPGDKTWAWALTHDVDTAMGYSNLEGLLRVEEDHRVSAAWYFVPERYPIDPNRLEELRVRGHEIGVHGLKHSGKLFSSRAEFESRLPRINYYVKLWRAWGFRSPATFRNPYWLPELDIDYDSSYMDNARFEPQSGGVCAPFPFMLSERLVELPITLPMDHTLINVLKKDIVVACERKLSWIRKQHGLALPLFHPDYNIGCNELQRYGRVVENLVRDPSGWYALPHEIADWWQRRRHSRVLMKDGHQPTIVGPAATDGRIWWAHRDGDTIRIEPARTASSSPAAADTIE